jgi:hypothetical protein
MGRVPQASKLLKSAMLSEKYFGYGEDKASGRFL